MSKNVILYIAHLICDHTIHQYLRLRNEIPENFDLWWCKDPNIIRKNTIELPKDINFLCYDSNFIYVQSKFFNPNYILEYLFYDLNKEYDFYYVIEYDVYYTGNWGDLFRELDKNTTSDLLATYIKKYERTEYKDLTSWRWFFDYEKFLDKRDPNIFYYLKSCLSFYRISNIALDFITKYEKNNIKTFIYEFYLPTLLYNYKFKIHNLHWVNGHDGDSDIEFNKYNYIEKPLYGVWYKTTEESKILSDTSRLKRDVLVTTYKSK